MANRVKGEVSVEIGGASYTLCMDMTAMVALEDYFSEREKRDVSFNEIYDQVQQNRMRYVQAFIWAAFLKHHPALTLQGATDLVQEYGGVFAFAALLGGIAAATSPEKADVEALGIDTSKNPPKAQTKRRAGSGVRSISTRAASV